MKTRLIAVYGSLRKDQYNYKRFKEIFGEQFKFIESGIATGWDLYDLGAYPGVKVSFNKTREVVVDILEVSEECFQAINAMEIGAGYKPVLDDINDKEVIIYEYLYGAICLVYHGDWAVHLKKKEADRQGAYSDYDSWD